MSKVKEVQAKDSDIEKTFVYRGLRLGIVKPYFPSGSGVTYAPVRNLGIIDEDGQWVYFLSGVDQDLTTAVNEAHQYVDDAIRDQRLYQQLVNLTNGSHDKWAFEKVSDAVRQVESILGEAEASANSIKTTELKKKAWDLIEGLERWFD